LEENMKKSMARSPLSGGYLTGKYRHGQRDGYTDRYRHLDRHGNADADRFAKPDGESRAAGAW
jgi:aryl-alcohol dehydrogenase-like predicted oxidoreductase